MKVNKEKKNKSIPRNFIRNKISYYLLGFYFGLVLLSDLGIKYFIKNKKEIDQSSFTKILLLLKVPYLIKPIFGLLTDFLPLFGYRRKSYLFLCSLFSFIFWISFLYLMNKNFIFSIISRLFINIFLSFTSVLAQAVSVEITKSGVSKKKNYNVNTSKLMSQFFIFRDIGMLIASFLGGFLIELRSLSFVFNLCALLPIFPFISAK